MASRKVRKNKVKRGPARKIGFWKNPINKHAAFLLLLTFIVFGNSISNDYTYDDKPFIAKNHIVKQGFKGIPTLLVTDFWAGYTNVHNVNPSYRPIPLISLAIEYQLFGLNPGANHFFNVLIYGLSCILLFFLLHAFFKDKYPYLALLTAVLFCVHPIHTEVVANVKGRDDLLALFNGLMALYLMVRYAKGKNIKFMIGALIFYLLALLSKEHVITWIGIIPLSLYFFSQLPAKKIAVYSSPFLGLSVVYFAIRTKLIGSDIVQLTDYIDNPILSATNAADMLATKIDVMGMYIKKLLIPHPLSSDYSYQAISTTTWANPEVYLWLMFYGILVYFGIKGIAKKKLYSYAILLFLFTIAPISNILFNYVVSFAERAMYTPSLGFILLISVLCYSVYTRALKRKKWINPKAIKIGAMGFMTMLVAVYAMLSYVRNPAWHDDYTLFSTDIQTMPKSVRLNIHYAQVLINRNTKNDLVPMNAELEVAKLCLDQATTLVPDLAEAQMLYGNLYKVTGNLDLAEKYYTKSNELFPNNPAYYFNIGFIAQIRQDFVKAKENYQKSLELFPNYTVALSNLGTIYGRLNELDKCIVALEKAIELQPDLISAYSNLERAYTLQGNVVKAEYYKQRKLEMAN